MSDVYLCEWQPVEQAVDAEHACASPPRSGPQQLHHSAREQEEGVIAPQGVARALGRVRRLTRSPPPDEPLVRAVLELLQQRGQAEEASS